MTNHKAYRHLLNKKIRLPRRLHEHIDLMEAPKGMKGTPIALITAGILALAFMGFTGIV